MTVKNIFDFLNANFPTDSARDFDNIGLLVGDPNKEVTNVLTALDCSLSVVNKAIEKNCDLIVTHHPVIFEPLKNVCKDSIVYKLIENNIAVISMHTNLDIAVDGVNDSLCRALGINDFNKVTAQDGFTLNTATLPKEITADELAETIKNKLKGPVRYFDSGKSIKKLIFCSGGGGGYIDEAFSNQCDALVTADVKHNIFIKAEMLGISVFDGGHFHTEDVVIKPLTKLLQANFPDIQFTDCHICKIKAI